MADREAMLRWPGWETTGVIGSGNGGTVYELERATINGMEKAALKSLTVTPLPEDAGSDSHTQAKAVYARLQRLAEIYSMLNETQTAPNVLRCDELSCLPRGKGPDWDVFLRTELLTPISRAVEMNPTEDTVIRLGMDICRALMAGRKFGIVHLDIKPQNIFRAPDGTFKLGDFGMAGLRPADISSISYMAPELYYKRQAGHQADIYSLGMVLFWLLNVRRLPFVPLPPAVPTSADADQARERRFGAEPIPDPIHGSEALKRIIRKACSFAPGQRYQTADEMMRDLASVPAVDAPAPAPQPPAARAAAPAAARPAAPAPAAPGEKKSRKRGALYVIIGILLVAALTVGVLAAWKTGFFGLLTPSDPGREAAAETGEPTPADETVPPAEETPLPTEAPVSTPAPVGSAWTDELSPGDVLRFGTYEQDGDPSETEPIRWIVLARDGDRLLLLSSRALDCLPFHAAGGEISWAGSSLRSWLNNEFLNGAFSEAQRAAILSTALPGTVNSESGLAAETTDDRVFVLSEEEVGQYLSDPETARTDATAYARAKGGYRQQDNTRTWWWLRTPGGDAASLSYVNSSGAVNLGGIKPDSKSGTVRPALWIDLKAVGEPGECLEKDGPKALNEAQRGDTVLLGRYEQDADAANGPEDIEWIVLGRSGNSLLLLSRYCLDAQPFHGAEENTTWSDSSIRTWLNGEFMSGAFDEQELALLLKKDLLTGSNPQYDTYQGSSTADAVFLLSHDELTQVLPAASERCAEPTPYAVSRGVFAHEESGYSWWWLRTSGRDRQHAIYVYSYGELDCVGNEITQGSVGVRPAIWVNAG